MSGSSIGGVVGGVVGFVASGFNPAGFQYGYLAGSIIGGAVDPDRIQGPRLTDAQTQTSNEGVPRPIIYGTACVAGNIIQVGPLVEHKTSQRAGKGGPVQETFTYTRDVAIRICEAAPLGGSMKLLRVWKNDKLVADWTEANTIPADTAAFDSILTFYSGDEDQLPDPTLEALAEEYGGGVGNVPAYRGTCYAVLTGLDVTETGGAVPQFRWEVSSDATQEDVVTERYVGPAYSSFTNNPEDPFTNPLSDYTVLSGAGTKLTGGGYTTPTTSIAAAISYAGSVAYPAWGDPDHFIGIMRGGSGPFSSANSDGIEGHGPFHDMTRYREAWLLYSWAEPVAFQDSLRLIGDTTGTPTSTGGEWNSDIAGTVFRSYSSRDSTTSSIRSGYEGFWPLAINIRCQKLVPVDALQDGEFELPDAPGFVSDAAGNIRKLGGAATMQTGLFRTLALESSSTTYTTRELGPVLVRGVADDTQAFWDAAYAAAVEAGEMPAGYTYSATGNGGTGTYPRNTTSAYLLTSGAQTVVTPGMVALDAIIEDFASRVGIPSTQLDLSAVSGIEVRGFPIARQTSAAEAVRALQQVYFFDLPEWGNSGDTGTKLRAVLRGGAVVATITDDDLVDTDDDESTRAQQVEFPRKVNLTASDPESNYEPITQPAERSTENVKAVGEASFSTNVVLTRSECAPVSEKLLKVMWEAALGRRTLELPEAFTYLTPSDRISYGGKQWHIDKAELLDGSVKLDLTRDRASAYASTATGSPVLPPTAPPSSIRGPTMFEAMNLPRLRSQDTTPGMYVAVCGLLPGWAGCDLYLSVDDGVTEQLVATLDDAATMGTLTADLAAAGTPLSVSLYGGELDSVTVDQLLARLNAAAVTTDEVSEILQFQTATETGTRAYDLTDLTRGELYTEAADHDSGDPFVLLDAAVAFVPLDIGLAGKTLIFRPVSRGTAPANNATYSIVFNPQFTGPQVVEAYVDDLGATYVDENGYPYYASEV